MEKKLIIVSNRLPFKVEKRNNKYEIREASGGLASALRSLLENNRQRFKIIWVGCADFSPDLWHNNRQLFDSLKYEIHPVFLHDKKTERFYYNGFSNSAIWPLFHYFPSFAEFNNEHYLAYRQVNKIFAGEVLKICRPDDTVWIHDYHLMLLPGMIKEQNPVVETGFFLHTPFPSYEIFRLLPETWREEILKSLIRADLVGLQTKEYVSHFLSTVSFILGRDHTNGRLEDKGHMCLVSDYPISIDYDRFHKAYDHPSVKKGRNAMLEKHSHVKLIFSVDRLDYTKGVLNRLSALENLLEDMPEYKEKIVFILNVIPSRDNMSKYLQRKKLIEENIGRLNGKYGNVNWQPVLYQYRHLSFNQLLTFYTACDVALVTPLRDGMNLVAKEYVASRADKRGVLVLSEMAGAANELEAAVMVNPTDTLKLKESLITALNMPAGEQERRLTVMQSVIAANNVHNWLMNFINDLDGIKDSNKLLDINVMSFEARNAIIEKYKSSGRRLILLDYDGTLSDFAAQPEQAIPSEQVLRIIISLSAVKENHICIISGRKARDLQEWFGNYHVTLIAEHGSAYRLAGSQEWLQMANLDVSWKEQVRSILMKQVLLYPGSFIEEKIYSLGWHYRNVEENPEEKVFIELNKKITAANTNSHFKVLHGNKVLEVKCANINKGIASLKILSSGNFDFVLAIGDDRTDEDIFEALNDESYVTIKVGLDKTKARYNMIGIHNVLSFLAQLDTLHRQHGNMC